LSNAGIPKRSFRKTNDQISALGLGGHHLGDAENKTIARELSTGRSTVEIPFSIIAGGSEPDWNFSSF
jgi:hypothetical protein